MYKHHALGKSLSNEKEKWNIDIDYNGMNGLSSTSILVMQPIMY